MRKERRNVILLLSNSTVHPTLLIDMYNNIKIVFLPKNAMSRLQPLDAGIVQSFRTKHRKKLMHYVIARINDDLFASKIAKCIDILQAITWVADAWKGWNCKMQYYWANKWRWRWHSEWIIQCTFQGTRRFRLWHDRRRICWFWCRNMQLFARNQLRYGRLVGKFS